MRPAFFILAGGLGTRARPLSDCRAKPAFPLLGIPLMSRLHSQIREVEIDWQSGWANLHHLPQTVVDSLPKGHGLKWVHEAVLTGSRVLTLALGDRNWTHLMVVNGDLYCRLPIERLFAEVGNGDGVIMVREQRLDEGYRRVLTEGNRFLRRGGMAEGGLMYGGVGLFSRRVIEAIRSQNLFDDLEREGFDIGLVRHDALWLDIGDPVSYYTANIRLMTEQAQSHERLWSPLSRVDAGSRVVRSILWPASHVRSGVALDACIVCDGVVPKTGRWSQGIWTQSGFHPIALS